VLGRWSDSMWATPPSAGADADVRFEAGRPSSYALVTYEGGVHTAFVGRMFTPRRPISYHAAKVAGVWGASLSPGRGRGILSSNQRVVVRQVALADYMPFSEPKREVRQQASALPDTHNEASRGRGRVGG
jgi:hypothetical protein